MGREARVAGADQFFHQGSHHLGPVPAALHLPDAELQPAGGSWHKLADLVVLDRDYFSVSDADMRRTRPVLTVVSGRIVYDAAGLS